jgi:site-specific recombinase XerD
MMPFTSALGPRLQAFIELKRALGHRYVAAEGELRRFDRYLASLDVPSPLIITRELVHGWLVAKPHVRPLTQASRAGTLRQFCLYLVRFDPRTYVPERALFPVRQQLFRAHIYSETELRALFQAACAGGPTARCRLRHRTLHAMLQTLYATGLRSGEACHLCIGDVDLQARTVFVRETKFFKSRLVPFSGSLADLLRSYLEARTAQAKPQVHAPFFINTCGRAFSPNRLSAIFRGLVDAVGLPRRAQVRGPCLHDLRHTFAVHRLLRWYREGADVLAKLPLLSTYMGHASVLSTQVYLTATTEVLREASGRFERAYGSLVLAPEEIPHATR